MAGEVDGYDEQSGLRISDADRHRVSELLRAAAGEGRLDLSELDQRLEATYAAKTYGDLVPITSDLPFGREHHLPQVRPDSVPRIGPPPGPARRFDTSVAIMGGTSRRGLWEVGETHNAVAVMGEVELDLRNARFTSQETVIRAFAFWAGIDIYVNAHTRVSVDGVGIMGAFDHGRDKVEPDLGPDSPLVRVTGIALMAGVNVQRRPPSEETRRRILGH